MTSVVQVDRSELIAVIKRQRRETANWRATRKSNLALKFQFGFCGPQISLKKSWIKIQFFRKRLECLEVGRIHCPQIICALNRKDHIFFPILIRCRNDSPARWIG